MTTNEIKETLETSKLLPLSELKISLLETVCSALSNHIDDLEKEVNKLKRFNELNNPNKPT